jgi:predicted NBD/HSP70 family sugar kinase
VAHRPGTPRLLRQINDRAALDLLLRGGPMTRLQLVAATGLSKPTASQLLGRLEDAGLVTVTGTSAGVRGPSAQVYSIRPEAGYTVGVDVTPGVTRAGVADLTGRIVGRDEVAIDMRRSPDPAADVAAAVKRAVRAARLPLRAVGQLVVASPGVHDDVRDVIRHAEHMPAWARPGLHAALSAELRVSITIENDVNAVAVAERARGAATDAESFALLWVSNGLGLAIDLGGRVHRGATGGAGEVGYMPLPGFAAERRSGRPVNFQSLVAGQAVVALARAHGVRGRTGAAVVGRAVSDHEAGSGGVAFLNELADRLATGIAMIVSVLDPELIVLSGDTAESGGEALRSRIEQRLRRLSPLRPRLALTGVHDDPVLAGALELGLRTVRDQVFTTTSRSGAVAGTAR